MDKKEAELQELMAPIVRAAAAAIDMFGEDELERYANRKRGKMEKCKAFVVLHAFAWAHDDGDLGPAFEAWAEGPNNLWSVSKAPLVAALASNRTNGWGEELAAVLLPYPGDGPGTPMANPGEHSERWVCRLLAYAVVTCGLGSEFDLTKSFGEYSYPLDAEPRTFAGKKRFANKFVLQMDAAVALAESLVGMRELMRMTIELLHEVMLPQ